MSIINELEAKLLEKKGKWKKIADDSGFGYEWISKFMQGKIINPGVHTVEGLIAYLDAADKLNKERERKLNKYRRKANER